MTKSELIEVIAERTKITKSRAELVVNCIFDTMSDALRQGQGIEIRGFGSFTIRHYKPYTGRNPRTNRPVPVGPKKLPFFKVGKDLKDLVNSHAHTPLPHEDEEPDETDLDLDHEGEAEGDVEGENGNETETEHGDETENA
jgi:integration host factor subunit beta